MGTGSERLLKVHMIPPSLWDGELRLPPCLCRAYHAVIKRNGLDHLVGARDSDNPPVGGLTQEHVDLYFAQGFDGAAARAELALLDPKNEVTPASDVYIISLSGNRLSLTDAPCGQGAAAYAFLACVAELRAYGVLPRLPLDVILIGAEKSNPSRVYASEMLTELHEEFEAQGIFVNAEFIDWDVMDVVSNTDLITRMTQTGVSCPKRLLLVANFSAFLTRAGKFKVAQTQLEELFRHASGSQSAAIWIEPNTNSATHQGGLFSLLRSLVQGAWKRFARERSRAENPIPTTAAVYRHPIDTAKSAHVRLAVMPIDLGRFP